MAFCQALACADEKSRLSSPTVKKPGTLLSLASFVLPIHHLNTNRLWALQMSL
jgi:hypothetical protein